MPDALPPNYWSRTFALVTLCAMVGAVAGLVLGLLTDRIGQGVAIGIAVGAVVSIPLIFQQRR